MAASTDRAGDKAARGRILGAIVAVSGILASGCGSAASNGPVDASSGADGSGGTTAHGSSNEGALPACTWPASLDDAAPRQCSAARAYVACQYPGGGSDCMSNDPTACPGAPGASCTDLCAADEYAVGCGGVGPAPSPPIPAGCRSLPSGPGGGTVGCCPCGGTWGSVSDGGALNQDADVSDAGYALCTGDTWGPNLVCEYPIVDGCSAKCRSPPPWGHPSPRSWGQVMEDDRGDLCHNVTTVSRPRRPERAGGSGQQTTRRVGSDVARQEVWSPEPQAEGHRCRRWA